MSQAAFLAEHARLTRRFFLQTGVASAVALQSRRVWAADSGKSKPDKAGARQDPYFTPLDDFRDVSRGKPVPHSLPPEKLAEVGLTRETWKLEVVSDSENPARLGKQLTKADNSALDFAGLLALGEKHAVRFPKIMTCLNIGCPLGMGLWEGVPLREVIWMTEPRENIRRVFYYGYHNDDPAQIFRSSLPFGRVLEDYYDLPPVILCYKLNGEFLSPERGGPVRIVVPEAYGFKNVKWLSHIVLTNLPHANDTYASGNNDLDSPMKTFSAVLTTPREVKAGEPIAVSGYAQVGVSGLSKVQVWMRPSAEEQTPGDPYFTKAPWRDAEVLSQPQRWDSLPEGKIPAGTLGFNDRGEPQHWPMRFAKIHWAATLPGLPAGDYELRSRTIDEKGTAQPMPRPFRKSGHAAIESVTIRVKA